MPWIPRPWRAQRQPSVDVNDNPMDYAAGATWEQRAFRSYRDDPNFPQTLRTVMAVMSPQIDVSNSSLIELQHCRILLEKVVFALGQLIEADLLNDYDSSQ